MYVLPLACMVLTSRTLERPLRSVDREPHAQVREDVFYASPAALLRRDEDLARWVGEATAFVATLPAKRVR